MSETKLSQISANPPEGFNKKAIKQEFRSLVVEFSDLQNLLIANGKHSLLVVLQGMDASGKDGTVRNVFSRINPMAVRPKSFKKPTDEEFAHDFLWRVHKAVPKKGEIGIFNRSHYEDVLIQRVHKWIDEDTVKRRFDHINNFERLLQDTGTLICKFYLHVSKDQQIIRLNERKEMLRKNWKHNDGDFEERKHWDRYMECYEDVFKYCSPDIPWTIVPANVNRYKEYVVVKTVVEKLKKLNMTYPALGSI